jgi:hypothetical protein
MIKHKIFILVWLGAVILILLMLVSPWWYNIEERREDKYTVSYRSEWLLTEMRTSYESDVGPDSQYSSSYDADTFEYDNIASVWLRTFLLVLLGLALNIAAFWTYLRYRKDQTTREWVLTITSLSSVIALIIPLFVMFSIPIAMDAEPNGLHFDANERVYTTFWGEMRDNSSELPGIIEMKYEWGPQRGWFFAWLVFGCDMVLLMTITPPPKPVDADVKLTSKAAVSARSTTIETKGMKRL